MSESGPRNLPSSLVIVVVVLGLSSAVSAQGRDLDVQRFVPALDDAGFLGIDATRTPGPGRLSLSLFSDLSLAPAAAELAGQERELVRTRVMTHFAAELGIGGRLAIGARLPMIAYQEGEPLAVGSPPLSAFAIADPSLVTRYRLLGPSAGRGDVPVDGPGLALQLSAALPLGHRDAFAGEGALRTDLTLLGDFQLLGAGIGASLGYRHRFEGRTLSASRMDAAGVVRDVLARYRDEMTFGAALKVPLPPAPDVTVVLETRGATDFRSAATTNLELDLGARRKFGPFTVALAGGVGLTRGIGTPDFRVMLGMWWSPPDTDTDRDGIPDARDLCPFLPEDLDGFEDEDGCPDLDDDGDLVPDVDDRCPREPAEEGRDEDEDGCTDALPPTVTAAFR